MVHSRLTVVMLMLLYSNSRRLKSIEIKLSTGTGQLLTKDDGNDAGISTDYRPPPPYQFERSAMLPAYFHDNDYDISYHNVRTIFELLKILTVVL